MSAGRFSLYELAPACTELVGRLIDLEMDSRLAGVSRPLAYVAVADVGLSPDELALLVEDGFVRVLQEGGVRMVGLTCLAREVLVCPVELGADGLPSSEALEARVLRRDQGLRRRARRAKRRR